MGRAPGQRDQQDRRSGNHHHQEEHRARALLVLIKRFFGWVVDQEIYGLSTSPCEGLSGKKLIGELQSRNRRLSDIELVVRFN